MAKTEEGELSECVEVLSAVCYFLNPTRLLSLFGTV